MKPQTKQIAKAVGAVVAGATAGYVAGVLTAPAAGAETRRRIGRRIEAEADDLVRKAKKGMKDGSAKLAEAMHR